MDRAMALFRKTSRIESPAGLLVALHRCGALLETCYFLRQQDSVGIAGYCISAVPYTRNLMLIYAKKKRDVLAAIGSES